MSFIAPLSPPDEHISTRPSSSKAHTGGGSVRLNTSGDHLLGPPRTVDRKRTGLRKTRTESRCARSNLFKAGLEGRSQRLSARLMYLFTNLPVCQLLLGRASV